DPGEDFAAVLFRPGVEVGGHEGLGRKSPRATVRGLGVPSNMVPGRTHPSSDGPPMAIDKIGKFTILDTLGTGAHSSILHIRRADDDREYALKLVNIEDKDDLKFLEQAKHEFRVGQMLHHPNLVKVYAFETEGGWFSGPKKAKLLIEFVPGKTMDKIPLVRMAKLCRMFERISDGLTHMHKQGVYHADMKPNNLI